MKEGNSRRPPARRKERRNSPRLRVNPLVYLNIAPDNGGFLFDLGESGMGVRVANPLLAAAEIRFSFLLEEHQLVQGTGKICWLSETGRSAGIRFVRLPDDSQSLIRSWMHAQSVPPNQEQAPQPLPDAVAKMVETNGTQASLRSEQHNTETHPQEIARIQPIPVLQAEEPKTPSSFTIFAPPPARPDAMPTEEPAPAQNVPETGQHGLTVETPLFFLPKKTAPAEAESFSESAEALHSFPGQGGRADSGSRSEETAALQSAILGGSPPAGHEQREKGQFKRLLAGTAVCCTLVVMAAMIYAYPGMFTGFREFIPQFESQSSLEPTNAGMSRTPQVQTGRQKSLARRRGRNWPYGYPTSAGGLLPRSAPGTPVSESLPFGQASDMVSKGDSTFPFGNAAQLSSRVKVSVTSFASGLELGGMLGDLRDDGALVEEGVPFSAPLNLGNEAGVPKPIVVEAEIGTDGRVKNVRLLSSPDSELARAVVAAVMHWRYRPMYESGEPVKFTTRITFDFSNPHSRR